MEICGSESGGTVFGDEGEGCSSNAKVEGQVRLAHLLSVDGVKLVVHGHCEDVLPQTHTTCRGAHRNMEQLNNIKGIFVPLTYLMTCDLYLHQRDLSAKRH